MTLEGSGGTSEMAISIQYDVKIVILQLSLQIFKAGFKALKRAFELVEVSKHLSRLSRGKIYSKLKVEKV